MARPVSDLAKLAQASYDPDRITSPRVIHRLDQDDVQAVVLEDNMLLLPGSNSVMDYLKFNLRPLNLGNETLQLSTDATEPGASGTIWHQGFLAYARVVFDWLADLGVTPTSIVGHSLGAAAAQILCRTYGVPTVGFAAPRPKFARGAVLHHDQLLIINRDDDLVPTLPTSFSHMTTPHHVKPRRGRSPFKLAHAMGDYITILSDDGAASVPKRWG